MHRKRNINAEYECIAKSMVTFFNFPLHIACNLLKYIPRHRSSNLNADLSRVNLINDPGCVCGWVIEDAIHFFLEYCLYVEAREQLTNNLQFLDSLLIEALLFGYDSLSEEQNAQIFKSVQL